MEQGAFTTEDIMRLMAEEEARKREGSGPPDFLGSWRDAMLGPAVAMAVPPSASVQEYGSDPVGAFRDDTRFITQPAEDAYSLMHTDPSYSMAPQNAKEMAGLSFSTAAALAGSGAGIPKPSNSLNVFGSWFGKKSAPEMTQVVKGTQEELATFIRSQFPRSTDGRRPPMPMRRDGSVIDGNDFDPADVKAAFDRELELRGMAKAYAPTPPVKNGPTVEPPRDPNYMSPRDQAVVDRRLSEANRMKILAEIGPDPVMPAPTPPVAAPVNAAAQMPGANPALPPRGAFGQNLGGGMPAIGPGPQLPMPAPRPQMPPAPQQGMQLPVGNPPPMPPAQVAGPPPLPAAPPIPGPPPAPRQSPVPKGPKFTKKHSDTSLDAMFEAVPKNFVIPSSRSPSYGATVDQIKSGLQKEYMNKRIGEVGDGNLDARVRATLNILRQMQKAGTDITKKINFSAAFGKKGTLSIAGAGAVLGALSGPDSAEAASGNPEWRDILDNLNAGRAPGAKAPATQKSEKPKPVSYSDVLRRLGGS